MQHIGMRDNTLYLRLGILRDATPSEIKSAYHKLVKLYHPDMPEGDAEKFHEVHEAYKVLNDPAKRKEYDQTGQWEEGGIPKEYVQQQAALSLIGGIFKKQLSQHKKDIIKVDVMFEIECHLDTEFIDMQEKISMRKRDRKELIKIAERISYNGDSQNILEGVIYQDIDTIERQMVQFEGAMETISIALKLLQDYDFKYDEQRIEPTSNNSAFTWG